ncbi:MAG: ABC transporter permease subunit [Treponema sp.]|nr:ABC transporter permease subunit [Treponema sp.]
MKNKKSTSDNPATAELINRKSKWHLLGKQKALILMSVPFVLYIILFRYIPLAGWTMAFQNYKPNKGMFDQAWVGFQWFKELFQSPEFLLSLRNTIFMSLISTALGYITAIVIAVFLNEVRNIAVKRFVQTVSYLPHFLSWIIVTSLIANALSVEDGVINNILMGLHIISKPIQFLSEPSYFWNIIGWTYVWKEVGWNTIVYLGAMTAIDPCLYEAAQIDGCGRLRKIRHITLPGIKSTIIIMMIMSAGHILDANFEMPYLLQNGMIQDVANQVDMYVLKYGFKLFNFSLATAAGIFKNVVNITFLLIANSVAKRAGEERLI